MGVESIVDISLGVNLSNMSRLSRRFVRLTVCVLIVLSTVFAGTVAAQDAVEISNAQELQDVRDDLGGNYVLTDDIDASGIEHFEPIGGFGEPFTGTFDGNGHTVSSLTVEPPEDQRLQDYAGLFGTVGRNGTVRELGIEDARVVGYQDVGGIAGTNTGEIRMSYFDGEVLGDTAVGGLVGLNSGELSRSYATVRIEATGNDVGGIVGSNSGNITEAYAAAAITAQGTGTGGAVGTGPGNTSHVYWDTEVSGITESERGTGLTTDEITGDAARENMAGFDFNGTWRATQNYPALSWQSEDVEVIVPSGDTDGDGTQDGRDGSSEDGTSNDGSMDGTDDTGGTDGGEGMPGFGVFAVFVALVGIGLFRKARRR